MRKFIIIITILFAVIVLVFSLTIYFLAKKAGQKIKVEKKKEVAIVSKISAEEKKKIFEEFEREKEKAKIKKVSEKVNSPVLLGEDILYLSQVDGMLYKISTKDSTKKETISFEKFPISSNLIWSPKKDQVIISNIDIDHISAENFLFDINLKKSQKLNNNIFNFTWSSDGEKIAYYYYNDLFNKKTINIADPDGSNWKKIFDLSTEKKFDGKDVIVVWSDNMILFYSKPIFLVDEYVGKNLIYSLYVDDSSLKELVNEGYATAPLFSPDGQKVLYNLVEDNGVKFTLNWIDKYGVRKKNLGIESKTKKCTWSKNNTNLYCALSEEKIISGFKLTMDTFWKINVETNEREKLTDSIYVDAENLFLSVDEKNLYFVDKNDFTLYELALK